MKIMLICCLVLLGIHIINAATDCSDYTTTEGYYVNCVPNAGVNGAKELLEEVDEPHFELRAHPVTITDYVDILDDRKDCASDERTIRTTYICHLVELCFINDEIDSCDSRNKDIFLLQHGLLDSSDTWMMSSAGLAYQLAKAGKHVFMGNSRGNKYCKLPNANTPHNYWEFSWDDMATFDQPAFFEKIKELTSDTPISYVGHSQGTIQMFAALSAGWIAPGKVKHFYALAPVVAIWETTSGVLRNTAENALLVDSVVLNQALMASSTTAKLISKAPAYLFKKVFGILNYLFAGLNKKGLISEEVKTKSNKIFPAGTSTRDVVHWNQLVATRMFTPFLPPKVKLTSSTLDIANKTIATAASTEINSWFDLLTYGARVTCRTGGQLLVSTVTNLADYLRDEDPLLKFYLPDGTLRCRWQYLSSKSANERPEYDLKTFAKLGLEDKVSLFFGKHDALATPSGVAWIADQIGLNPERIFYYPDYDHVAFTWSQFSITHIGEVILDIDENKETQDVGIFKGQTIYIRGDKLNGWPDNGDLEDYNERCVVGLEELEDNLDQLASISF